MTALRQQVRRTLTRHSLCPPGSRVLVGLSGGSDSVALTWLLRELSEHGRFTVVALAHLNHQLRLSAIRDEAFCRSLARRLALPLMAETVDVRKYAQEEGLSGEDAARRLRYDFFGRVAAEVGADRIAVGHTQDDQAETLLLKLMRGAGLTGLAGIYPKRGPVIRPLLDVSRGDLRDYLTTLGEPWVDDETNEDLSNPRNRVRHVLLPALDRTAGWSTRPAMARAAALLRDDALWLDQLAEERFPCLAADNTDGLEFDVGVLSAEPLPLLRRVLLQAMRRAGGREIGLEHVEAALALLNGTGGGVDVPGCRVELWRQKLVLVRQKVSMK